MKVLIVVVAALGLIASTESAVATPIAPTLTVFLPAADPAPVSVGAPVDFVVGVNSHGGTVEGGILTERTVVVSGITSDWSVVPSVGTAATGVLDLVAGTFTVFPFSSTTLGTIAVGFHVAPNSGASANLVLTTTATNTEVGSGLSETTILSQTFFVPEASVALLVGIAFLGMNCARRDRR